MHRTLSSASHDGFTLVELIVAISISILVVIVATAFERDVISLNRNLQAKLSSEGEVRTFFNRVTSELRSAGPSATGAYTLAKANDNEIIFYDDVDGDGAQEEVHYVLSGTTLRRGIIKPTGNPPGYVGSNETFTDVVHDVTGGPIFQYYDTNYNGTTAALTQPVDLSAVRLVKVTLTVDHDITLPPGPVSFTTQVTIRNVKDNL